MQAINLSCKRARKLMLAGIPTKKPMLIEELAQCSELLTRHAVRVATDFMTVAPVEADRAFAVHCTLSPGLEGPQQDRDGVGLVVVGGIEAAGTNGCGRRKRPHVQRGFARLARGRRGQALPGLCPRSYGNKICALHRG